MKSRYITNLLGALVLVSLAGCSGSGSCPPGQNGGNSAQLALTLTAPNQYPAGMPTPITAYLTIANISDVNATNLNYSVPDSTNKTGVSVTVANDSSNPCKTIPAHDVCTFPAIIGANAKPGSFIVTATPTVNSAQSSYDKILASAKNKLGLQSTSLELKANIGLVDAEVDNQSGADGITLFYDKTIQGSATEDTYVTVVAYVSSPNAGNFNSINLVDSSGKKLDFEVLSGNTGGTDLAQGSIVTLRIKVSAGTKDVTFYTQTAEKTAEGETPVNTSEKPHGITVADSAIGILSITPNLVNLISGYQQATFTIYNSGMGIAKDIAFSGISSPLQIVSTTCGVSLESNASCYYIVNNSATNASGSQTLTVQYNNGSAVKTILAQLNYTSESAIYGVSLSSTDNPSFEFVATTTATSESSVVKLTNTGGFAESDFVLTLPTYFSASSYSGANACTLNNNTITSILNSNGDYCYFVLTYTNPDVTATTSTSLKVNYKYNGNKVAPEITNGLTYTTNLALANLAITPTATTGNPYVYTSIVSNSGESHTQVFVVTNNGQASASSLAYGVMTGNTSYFTRISSQSNDCATKNSLAIGETCNVTIKFGPNSTSMQNATVTLPLNYTSAGSGTTAISNIVVRGTVRQPLAANVIISSITASNAVAGNGESSTSAFQIESTTALATRLTLTYVNTADSDATQFSINYDQVPAGYSVNTEQSTCGNSVSQLLRNSGNSCVVVLNSTVATPGNNNLSLLGSLLANWHDETGAQTDQQISWLVNSSLQTTAYMTVFPAPVIVVTSDPSPVGTVNQGDSFAIVATLQGGYNVAAQPLTVTGLSAQLFSVAPANCSVKSITPQQLSCTFTVTVLTSTFGSYTATVSNSGSVPVTPATVAFDANQPAKSVALQLESTTIDVGMSRMVTATLSEAATGSPVTVTFTSSSPGVASVQASCSVSVGQTQCQVGVYGVAAGTSSISASATGGFGTASGQNVTVTLVPTLIISVGSTLLQGDPYPTPSYYSTNMTASVYPAATSNTTVTFSLTKLTGASDAIAFDSEGGLTPMTCTITTGQESCTIVAPVGYSDNGLQHVNNREGTSSLQASASGYGTSNQITIEGKNTVTPSLTLSLVGSNPVYIDPVNPTTTVTTTATLSTPAVGSVTVNFTTPTAGWVGYYTNTMSNTDSCVIANGNSSCSVLISPIYFGSFTVNASASGYATDNQKILYIQQNP